MTGSDGEYVDKQSRDDDDDDDHYMTLERGEDRRNPTNNGQRHGRHLQPGGPGGPGGANRKQMTTRNGQQQHQQQRKKPNQRRPQQAAWETVKRSWDTVGEADDGQVLGIEFLEAAEKRRRVLRDTTPLQRGIIRHMVLVIDMSFAMLARDYLPTCHRVALATAADFVRAYFEQNPISQLAILAMRDGVALRVSDMGGNPAEHLDKLHEWDAVEPQGHASLQNALEMCRGTLFHTPSHGTREVLVIFGALLSSDPGDIHDTIGALLADRIRVSIVGLAAKVAICSEICTRTNGGDDRSYAVALHDVHFRELVLGATTPPATQQKKSGSSGSGSGNGGHGVDANEASLLMMGFPSRSIAKEGGLSLCACHNKPVHEGYACTRCDTKVCRLPSECPACGLTLILSTHLARSYHHLFPLRNWVEVPWLQAAAAVRERGALACQACLVPFPELPSDDKLRELQAAEEAEKVAAAAAGTAKRAVGGKPVGGATTAASGAAAGKGSTTTTTTKAKAKANDTAALIKELKGVSESGRYACEVCGSHFCIDCDVFAHEVIHNCPGCQSDTRSAANKAADAQARAADVAKVAAAATKAARASAAAASGHAGTGGGGTPAGKPRTKILLKTRGGASHDDSMVID